MNSSMIKAVLWDLGGVLVRTETWEPRRTWERRLGLPENQLSKLVFESDVAQDAMHGRASVSEVWTWVFQQLKIGGASKAQLIHDFWSGDQLDQNLVEFIRQLRPRWKTGLITNAFPEIRQELDEVWQIADAFDSIVVSAEVGVTKPEAEIYQHCLYDLKISPSEAIFVDDFVENVVGAENLGMHALHFTTPNRALGQIERLLHL
jgi:epoxide hydrolase-like predicted phosphatase